MEPIVNKVAESDIVVYDLASIWNESRLASFDLAPFLYQEMILREKDFRTAMKEYDWTAFAGAHVAVFCSVDAIIPTWAYMLVASKLKDQAASVGFGTTDDVVRDFYVRALDKVDWSQYEDQIVVIKGCGNKIVPMDAYMIVTQKLQDVARKLMYGEPCSSVPLWRRPKMPAQ